MCGVRFIPDRKMKPGKLYISKNGDLGIRRHRFYDTLWFHVRRFWWRMLTRLGLSLWLWKKKDIKKLLEFLDSIPD